MAWSDLIPTSSPEQTLRRAYSSLKRSTVYRLGEGGFDPTSPLGPCCDCSGFIAWVIGIPRELPPGSARWLSSTRYWSGGHPFYPGLFREVPLYDAGTGDLLVYPHHDDQVGHIGLICAVNDQRPAQVLHCSSGNYKQFNNAIRITSPEIFFEPDLETRTMRVNYEILRELPIVSPARTGLKDRPGLLKWRWRPPFK